jgi:hypothetical protein
MRRIDTVLTVYCQHIKKRKSFEIITSDLNILGIRFLSPLKLHFDDVLEMKIHLSPNHPPVLARGRVVWIEKKSLFGHYRYEGGIEFLSIDERDRSRFQKFIDRHWMN